MNAIETRAAEIVAEWAAAEAARAAREAAHYAWVDQMVAEGTRRECLPCHHGTAFWPDFGQVCGGCEAEGEAEAYDDRTPAEIEADLERAALAQATREAEVVDWSLSPF